MLELCEPWHHQMMHSGVKKQALGMQRWFDTDEIGLYNARPGEGGETQTPQERKHTTTKGTGGAHQKGNRTKLAEPTDLSKWRTSRRRQGTPRPATRYKHREGREGGKARGRGR